MRIVNFFILYTIVAGLSSCSSGTSASSSANKNAYQEDISFLREDYTLDEPEASANENTVELPITGTIDPQNDITTELDSKLERIAEENKSKLVSGYTIQVYTGASRETANNAKDMVYRVVPDARPQIQYVQPNYKVKVGRFINRIEAQKTYTMLKKQFPSAMIIPERFSVQ